MGDLSVVIPIYNASFFIEGSIQKIIAVLQEKKINYELVLCDDGSTDSSWDLLQGLVCHETIRIYRNDSNQGLGFTLRRLFLLARAENVIYCDIDLPFRAQGLVSVLEEMGSADIVVASRYMGYKAQVPLVRRFFSRAYWFLVRRMLDIAVKDLGSGTVGIKQSKIFPLNLRSNGFDIHLELYVKAQRHGLVVKEIGLPSVKSCHPGAFSVLKHGPAIMLQTLKWRISFKENF